jgi:hypothetical protein
MKTLSKIALLLVLAIAMFISSCAGGYFVYSQPVEPVYERPLAPYSGAIWIDGDWTWSGGSYVYVRGHWDHPREGRAYVRGTWEHNNHGYRWQRGHWR